MRHEITPPPESPAAGLFFLYLHEQLLSTEKIAASTTKNAQIPAMLGLRRSLITGSRRAASNFEFRPWSSQRSAPRRLLESRPHRRSLSSAGVLLKKPDTQGTGARTSQSEDDKKQDVQKGAKKSAGKTSLRRVAVEVERLRRGFIKEKGKKRFVDPDVETKVQFPTTVRSNGR